MNKKNLKTALLFINGNPPKNLPDLEGYEVIVCTDGAFHYLKSMNFPLEKLDFISGDFDSHSGKDEDVYQDKFINTPDQGFTDFQKALEILKNRNIEKVCVYGASGGEQDHFLGNLHVAFLFKNQFEITFYDEFSTYFFAPKSIILDEVEGKMISLVPFPIAENVVTKGLKWSLNCENLSLTQRIGTRNIAVEQQVSITFDRGDIILFIGK